MDLRQEFSIQHGLPKWTERAAVSLPTNILFRAHTILTSSRYTNQATAAGGKATHFYGTAPADVTSAYHEYRIDWTSNSTEYYLDGVLQRTMTTNVASVASAFVLNNWVNGDPSWTLGPPTTDGVLQIRKVTLAYNP